MLDAGNAQLPGAGFSSRSGYSSPTFGGLSWLAHSTLQSGVRVDGEQRYDQLVENNRRDPHPCVQARQVAAVAAMPANRRAWPGSTFYGYDGIYDRRNLGYRGPGFGLPPMPDQYTFLELQRRELAKRRRPPFLRRGRPHLEPRTVDAYPPAHPLGRRRRRLDLRSHPGEGVRASLVGDAERARAAYGHSIQYSLRTLFSFVQRYGDDNLVLVVLGDHQPATTVTGWGASHDVPISVIARPECDGPDRRMGMRDGMLPGPQAPVWPMAAFRDLPHVRLVAGGS